MSKNEPPAPEGVKNVYLEPGATYFGDGNIRLKTLLGSCVSITFWHPVKNIGGMCHYMLPGRSLPAKNVPDGRYANEAIQILISEARKYGADIQEFDAKIFGGGEMFRAEYSKLNREMNQEPIGIQNVNAAVRLLKQYGVTVKGQHAGQQGHRRIMFDLWNGDTWVQHHSTINN